MKAVIAANFHKIPYNAGPPHNFVRLLRFRLIAKHIPQIFARNVGKLAFCEIELRFSHLPTIVRLIKQTVKETEWAKKNYSNGRHARQTKQIGTMRTCHPQCIFSSCSLNGLFFFFILLEYRQDKVFIGGKRNVQNELIIEPHLMCFQFMMKREAHISGDNFAAAMISSTSIKASVCVRTKVRYNLIVWLHRAHERDLHKRIKWQNGVSHFQHKAKKPNHIHKMSFENGLGEKGICTTTTKSFIGTVYVLEMWQVLPFRHCALPYTELRLVAVIDLLAFHHIVAARSFLCQKLSQRDSIQSPLNPIRQFPIPSFIQFLGRCLQFRKFFVNFVAGFSQRK